MLWSMLALCVLAERQSYEEAKRRLELAAEDRKRTIPDLRKQSRRQYLVKRGKDKLEDLEAEIQDEHFMFGDTK